MLPKLFAEHGNIPIQRKDNNITVTQGSALVTNYARRTTLQIFLRELTYHFRLEQQLRQAQRVSAIGQLISGMAHELNNPLAVISGYAQLISMRKTVEKPCASKSSASTTRACCSSSTRAGWKGIPTWNDASQNRRPCRLFA